MITIASTSLQVPKLVCISKKNMQISDTQESLGYLSNIFTRWIFRLDWISDLKLKYCIRLPVISHHKPIIYS